MKYNFLKEVRVVKALVDNEMIRIGEQYEEYFDKAGYFYRIDPEYLPEGLGVPLDTPWQQDSNKSWLAVGMVELVKTIPVRESIWGRKQLVNILAKHTEIQKQIEYLREEIQELNNVIKNYYQITLD